LSSLAQWLGPEEGETHAEQLPRDAQEEHKPLGLWGQINAELAARSLPMGQGDTWDNKEEF
jgi:hypothetical protein